nr:orexin receptor type 1 [Leptinotarsa decemlineata]
MKKEINSTIPENDIPPEVWAILHEFLLGIKDPELDLREPHLKTVFSRIYPFIIFIYALLVVAGLFGNLTVFVYIIRHKLYSEETYTFLLNNVISDIIKCVVVLPISLYVLIIQNWVLGELLCSFLPMIQDIPLHTSTLTFLLLAWDRFRFIRNPNTSRLPALVCTIGTWLTSGCLVLPYPIYIIYIDLGKYSKMNIFQGVGVCTVNLADDMKEYMRGIFLIMYAAPLATISYLFIRISRELATQSSSAVITFQSRCKEKGGRPRTDSHSTTVEFRNARGKFDRSSQYSRSSCSDYDPSRAHYEVHDPDLNVAKEMRTQKFLVTMITTYGICLCPLMILRLARLALIETYDNSGHFDITFAIFVWIAFLPTCSTPLLFAVWQINGSRMERLRGYFRFSNQKFRQSCETVTTAAGTPAAHRSRRCQHSQLQDEGISDTNSFT